MILFLHIEKTAGTSLSYYLKSKHGNRLIDLYPVENGKHITDNDIKNAIKYNHKPEIITSHKIHLDKINLNRFKQVIITTRNPFDRFLSHINHLNELKRLECIDLEKAYSYEDFINLQYKKLGGKKGLEILKKLNEEGRLISIKQSTFKEDLKFFINEKFNVPLKNIRNKKELPFNDLNQLRQNFESLNQEEIELINAVQHFKQTQGKNSLEFNNINSKNIKVKKANFYRKYYRLPLLIIKHYLKHKKIIQTKNMSGYYICTKKELVKKTKKNGL